ncbi:hypothetical protein M427DRAFT_133428 [Gonapodya prolifera JEL478]|uniref:SH3 domain-containing protein n=1 Tax=Gonapodya prolifera (strain JEL478) TaxID=1344416 RepID=A0A139ALS6_GONPJ|nr:hypothetical protein M427DRAFT_133428 [Gonapodya prolifera JEL478]|eukprot:KXS17638.1 hypothetical protein M427DRAFT_133428 [Gonapodya prolifera JEL478]
MSGDTWERSHGTMSRATPMRKNRRLQSSDATVSPDQGTLTGDRQHGPCGRKVLEGQISDSMQDGREQWLDNGDGSGVRSKFRSLVHRDRRRPLRTFLSYGTLAILAGRWGVEAQSSQVRTSTATTQTMSTSRTLSASLVPNPSTTTAPKPSYSCLPLHNSSSCGAFGPAASVNVSAAWTVAMFDNDIAAWADSSLQTQSFNSAYGCSWDGTPLRYALSYGCAERIFSSDLLCNSGALNSTTSDIPPFCKSTCQDYLSSVRSLLSNTSVCATGSSVGEGQLLARTRALQYVEDFCNSRASDQDGCVHATGGDNATCGFGGSHLPLAGSFCSTSSDPCCSFVPAGVILAANGSTEAGTRGTVSNLSTGAVIGIAIAVALALVAIVLGLVYMLYVRPRTLEKYGASRRQLERLREVNTAAMSSMPPPVNGRARELAHRRSMRSSTVRASLAAPSLSNGDIPFTATPPTINKQRSASVRSARSAKSGRSGRSGRSGNRRSRASSMPGSPTLSFAARSTGRRSMDSAAPKRHVAIHAYTPRLEDEVALQKGDVVYIREIFNDGWVRGANWTTGAEGTFPVACIEPAEESSSDEEEEIRGRQSWNRNSDTIDIAGVMQEGAIPLKTRPTTVLSDGGSRPRSGALGGLSSSNSTRRNSRQEPGLTIGGSLLGNSGTGGAAGRSSRRESGVSKASEFGEAVSDDDDAAAVWRGVAIAIGGANIANRKTSPGSNGYASGGERKPNGALNGLGSDRRISGTAVPGARNSALLARRPSRRDTLTSDSGARLSSVVNPHLTIMQDQALTAATSLPGGELSSGFHPPRTNSERLPDVASPATLRGTRETFANVSNANVTLVPLPAERPTSAFADTPLVEPARPPSRMSAISLGSSVHENPFAEDSKESNITDGDQLGSTNTAGMESPIGWHDILADALDPTEDLDDNEERFGQSAISPGTRKGRQSSPSTRVQSPRGAGSMGTMDAPVVSVKLLTAREVLAKHPSTNGTPKGRTKSPRSPAGEDFVGAIRNDASGGVNGRRDAIPSRTSWASGEYPPSLISSIAGGRTPTSPRTRDKSAQKKMRSSTGLEPAVELNGLVAVSGL